MAKHAALAFALWLVGSFAGLHHLYLHRPHAAFLSVVTLQGFGLLWFYDLLSLPQFVAQANASEEYRERLRVIRKFHTRPPLSLLASLVQIISGTVFGALVACLAPAQWPNVVDELLFVVGTAWGVAFSGNAVDLETHGELKYVLGVLSVVVISALVYYGGNVGSDDYKSVKAAASFVGTGVCLLTRQWSPQVEKLMLQDELKNAAHDQAERPQVATPTRRPAYWRTLLTYWALLVAFVVCGTTAIVNHGVIRVYVNGVETETPFFEACQNFVESEAFQTFVSTMKDLYYGERFEESYQHRWKQFNAKMDLSGRYRYLKVLGLPRDASDKDIRATYRKLVLQYHPDKYSGDDHDHAQAKFIKIQEAYKKLVRSRESDAWDEL